MIYMQMVIYCLIALVAIVLLHSLYLVIKSVYRKKNGSNERQPIRHADPGISLALSCIAVIVLVLLSFLSFYRIEGIDNLLGGQEVKSISVSIFKPDEQEIVLGKFIKHDEIEFFMEKLRKNKYQKRIVGTIFRNIRMENDMFMVFTITTKSKTSLVNILNGRRMFLNGQAYYQYGDEELVALLGDAMKGSGNIKVP